MKKIINILVVSLLNNTIRHSDNLHCKNPWIVIEVILFIAKSPWDFCNYSNVASTSLHAMSLVCIKNIINILVVSLLNNTIRHLDNLLCKYPSQFMMWTLVDQPLL